MIETFTLEKAFEYQREDLFRWKGVLKKWVYAMVENKVLGRNKNVTDPYSVVRGYDIEQIVSDLSYKIARGEVSKPFVEQVLPIDVMS